MKRGHILVDVILILIALVLLVAVLTHIFGKVNEETAVTLCRTINAGNVELLPTALRATSGGVQACQVIDRGAIPEGKFADYPNKDIGTKAEIADMIVKCWSEWLEGIPDKSVTAKLIGSDACFPCYLFTLKKGVAINAADLRTYLEQSPAPKGVKDTSDKCDSTQTGGGRCFDACGSSQLTGLSYSTKEASSKKCPTQKCCVPTNRYAECIAKGGGCLPSTEPSVTLSSGELAAKHTWLCPDNQKCYVPQSRFTSYVGYVQSGGLGPGFIAFHEQMQREGLQPGKQYVVAFNENPAVLNIGFPDSRDSTFDSILVGEFTQLHKECKILSGTGKS